MKWQEFVQNVQRWAEERNIIKGSTVQAQALKGVSEAGEMADNVAKGNLGKLKDDIGDNCVVSVIIDTMNGIIPEEPKKHRGKADKYYVVANIVYEWHGYLGTHGSVVPSEVAFYCRAMADLYELNFGECLAQAWHDIKDRKGIMHSGVFVKSTDARYEELVKLYVPE